MPTCAAGATLPGPPPRGRATPAYAAEATGYTRRERQLPGGVIPEQPEHGPPAPPPCVDRPVFSLALLCLLGVSIPILMAPEAAGAVAPCR